MAVSQGFEEQMALFGPPQSRDEALDHMSQPRGLMVSRGWCIQTHSSNTGQGWCTPSIQEPHFPALKSRHNLFQYKSSYKILKLIHVWLYTYNIFSRWHPTAHGHPWRAAWGIDVRGTMYQVYLGCAESASLAGHWTRCCMTCKTVRTYISQG